MQSTMLVLEFGKTQSILQTERNLWVGSPGSAHITSQNIWNYSEAVIASIQVLASCISRVQSQFFWDSLTWAISILRMAFSADPGCDKIIMTEPFKEKQGTQKDVWKLSVEGSKGEKGERPIDDRNPGEETWSRTRLNFWGALEPIRNSKQTSKNPVFIYAGIGNSKFLPLFFFSSLDSR
jgi:hypothetical protein